MELIVDEDEILSEDGLNFVAVAADFGETGWNEFVDDIFGFEGPDVGAVVAPVVALEMPGLFLGILLIHTYLVRPLYHD